MENRRNTTVGILNTTKRHTMYECRGEVMYDDDHDQMPEPELWSAAMITRGRTIEQ